jgi:hypothetical protein
MYHSCEYIYIIKNIGGVLGVGDMYINPLKMKRICFI